MKYTVYVECLGGDEQLVSDVETGDTMGFDLTQDNVKPHWFDTLKEAREFVEFSDEYIEDEDGRLSDKDGNWYGHGMECSDCMGRGHMDNDPIKGDIDECDTCEGTGKFQEYELEDRSRWYKQRQYDTLPKETEKDMIATLKHELNKKEKSE